MHSCQCIIQRTYIRSFSCLAECPSLFISFRAQESLLTWPWKVIEFITSWDDFTLVGCSVASPWFIRPASFTSTKSTATVWTPASPFKIFLPRFLPTLNSRTWPDPACPLVSPRARPRCSTSILRAVSPARRCPWAARPSSTRRCPVCTAAWSRCRCTWACPSKWIWASGRTTGVLGLGVLAVGRPSRWVTGEILWRNKCVIDFMMIKIWQVWEKV